MKRRGRPRIHPLDKEQYGPTVHKIARITSIDVPKRASVLGDVLVCGQGDMGQLGLGDDGAKFELKRPALLESIKDAVDVVAGGMHSLILTNNGTVYSFGCNDEGALGRDSSEDGSDFVPGKVELPDEGIKISAGDSHSACLLKNGKVYAWGSFRDSHGNMGLTLEGNKHAPVDILPNEKCCAIASGADHLAILTCNGKVYTVGCGEQGQLGRVSIRSASGEGRRGKNELLRPLPVFLKGNSFISEIWATNYCTFLREHRTDTIWAFGLNNYKQLLLPIKSDIVSKPVKVSIRDVKQIAGGQHHTIVLKRDLSCHVIGRSDYGRLGLGSVNEDVVELEKVEDLENEKIVYVACGEAQSFAINDKGDLYAWGMGSNLQLGTGSEDDALEPVLIKSKNTKGKYVFGVSSGGQHTILLIHKEDISNTSEHPIEKVKENNGVAIVTSTSTATTTMAIKSSTEPIVTSTTKMINGKLGRKNIKTKIEA